MECHFHALHAEATGVSALRAVMVAPAFPTPRGNGLAMRLSLFLEALQSIARTDLILIPVLGDSSAQWAGDTPILRVPLQRDTELTLLLQVRDPRQRLASFVRYGKSTFSGQFSNAAWAELYRKLSGRHYDIVHVARSHLIPALAHFRGRFATTLDLDEDDLASFSSLAQLERRQRLTFRADWQEQEGRASDCMIGKIRVPVDAAFAASQAESRNLSRRHAGLSVEYVPNAVALKPTRPLLRLNTLLFVGTLRYPPNNEGLLWFLDHILPRIRRRQFCRVVIIGNYPLPQLQAAARRHGAQLLQGVQDLQPYYRLASAVIAPMRSGGGTRIKLLEAASFGVPSIATPAAASGLYSKICPWGWLADDPGQFAAACITALRNAKLGTERGARGRTDVSRKFDRAKVVRDLARRFEQLVAGKMESDGRN